MGTDDGSVARTSASQVFKVPEFSLYFGGQLLSNTGLWFQNLAISLIVLEMTGSASALSFVTVAQFGPLLLLAGLAGKVSDMVSPRTVLLISSIAALFTAVGLAWEISRDDSSLITLYFLLVLGGTVAAFERVAAQAFVFELVGAGLLQNAAVLSTMYVSAARSIGPGLAGVSYLAFGAATCLLINAASYLFVFVSLLLIRPSRLHPRRLSAGTSVSFRQVLSEVRGNRDLMVILIVNSVATFSAMNMNVVLTSAVSFDFDGDAGALGLLHALNAVGAVVGGYLLTRVQSITASTLGPSMLIFSIALGFSAASPTLILFMLVAPLLGFGIGVFQGVVQSAAQMTSPPHMIGRTMSLVTMGNYGIAPFGAVVIGVLIDFSSARVALWFGCVVTAALSIMVYAMYRKRRPDESTIPVE